MKHEIAVIGIDLAKSIFQVCAATTDGKRVFNRQIRRHELLPMLANLPVCLIGMEACSSSHYWAREIRKLGHDVKLMPPQYVKPYVKTNKSDNADADAICEAVTRPNMRFVAIKSPDQQALLLLHRDRKGQVRDRTALANRLRATLGEFGIIVPVGLNRLREWLVTEYGQHQDSLPDLMQSHVARMSSRLSTLDAQIKELEREINAYALDSELCRTLQEVPGIGPLTASAIVACAGDVRTFSNGRQFAAWLGLVPRQHSSGGKRQLLGISKRGDTYLRSMLIHGARAIVRTLNPKRSATLWLEGLLRRRHKNVVVVAMANKLARIAWALLAKGGRYHEGQVFS